MVHLTGRNLEALEVVVSELLRSRLVGQDERGNEVTYEVAHPLIQDIIYEGIGRPRRRVVHRQVARALMTSGRFGEAAAHFARSAAAGDAEAIDAVRRALQQAEEREAYGEALSILGALVDLLKPDDGRWLEVAETLSHRAEWVYRGGSRALIGSPALRAIDSALEGSTDARTRAAIKLRLANLLAWGTGELDDAERSAACALELFQEAGESAKALRAANELAWVRGLKGDVAGWQEGAQRVVRAARAGDEQFVLMHGLASVGISSFMRGRFAEAEGTLRAGARIAREVGKLPALAMILSSLGVSLALEGRLEEALVLLEEGRSANPGCQERVLVEWELIVQWLAGRIPAGLAGADDALARNPGTSKRRGNGMLF